MPPYPASRRRPAARVAAASGVGAALLAAGLATHGLRAQAAPEAASPPAAAGPAAPAALPARVDLRADQTPIRNQHARDTCTVFAATAALEAAYRRAGHPAAGDLSEELLNWTQKMFWLHPTWSDIARAEQSENQAGVFSGGSGADLLQRMVDGLRVPVDGVFPYRPTPYQAELDHPWTEPFWQLQRNQDDVNLDPSLLPAAALTAPAYYQPAAVRKLADPRDPAAIEAALAAGREVVVDLHIAHTSPDLWTPCGPGEGDCTRGAHAVVVVGYDRSDPDPARHHFITKNSWGRDPGSTRSDGFTYLSYDYIRSLAWNAAYIESVKPPAAWPELGFVGRWPVSLSGTRGTLDLYHLPGIAQGQLAVAGVSTPDRRLGTFFDTRGRAYRVNGTIQGNTVRLRANPAKPNLRWDELSGGTWTFRLQGTGANRRLVPA